MRRLTARLCAALAVATAVLAPVAPATAAPARGTGSVCPADRLPPLPFADVRAGDTFAPAIACVLGTGIARGVSPTSYAPGPAVSRGQLVLFLTRVAARAQVAVPDDGAARFSDLGHAPPAVREAAEALADADVVSGYGDGTFRPAAPVRRDQMATFLVRLQGLLEGPRPAPEVCFTDTVGNPHADSIGTLCALGVVTGRSEGRYAPAGEVTRAQMAGFLARLLDVDAEAGIVPPLPPVPAYDSSIGPIDDATAARMSASHRAGCPVSLSDLRLLRLRHWGFDGATHVGEMVVHADVSGAVVQAFGDLYAARVVVERIRLVDEYGADDDRSMAANNSSAYNCRTVAGSTTWSQHAYGRALDVNPVQNPYVSGSGAVVEPPAGGAYRDRADVRPGMIVRPGPVVDAFTRIGWGWGGDFTRSKDYQHFSANGR
jgi:hypothetical protein